MPTIKKTYVFDECFNDEYWDGAGKPIIHIATHSYAMRVLYKINATLWKCRRVRFRHYILTALVILIPVLLFAMLGYAKTKIGGFGKTVINDTTYTDEYYEEQLYERYQMPIHDMNLLYAPATKFTNNLMKDVQGRLYIPNDKIREFDSEDSLIKYYNNNRVPQSTYAVIFKDLKGDETPDSLNYNIRNFEKYLDWATEQRFETMQLQYIPGTGSEKYFTKGFILLQMAIDKFYIQEKSSQELPFHLSMQEFPYPPHVEDLGMQDLFIHTLPFVTLFSFVLTIPSILKRIVEEKESGAKELMKMMGLPPGVMWMCWYIDAMIINIVSLFAIVACLKCNWGTPFPPIEFTGSTILYVFFLLYVSSCVAYCFVVSTILNSPSLTTIAGILVWIISYMIPYSIGESIMLSFTGKLLLSFVPNIAMYYGFQAIAMYETRGIGAQWNNLFLSASGGVNDITMGYIFIMLFVDTILLMLLTFYLDSVRPGRYGVSKPWMFPFHAVIKWFKNLKFNRPTSVSSLRGGGENNYCKVELCKLVPGVEMKNLRKNYGCHRAVNDLSLKFFKGEITALLGHNGAGKTTIMSIMTGMIKASHGEVLIEGHDINQELDYVRTLIGVCPQHNLVFPDLTVFEHMKFFAKLNDIKNPDQHVNKLIDMLGLHAKSNSLPHDLSGGMKRKLCLGMALVSNPKIIILDEPTSGLDPKSRREIWDILLKLRKDDVNHERTILISTHFMEEVDVLGDRIAVLDHGNLIAHGTPMFLKSEFNTGCNLTIIKSIYENDFTNSEIDKIVKKYINIATLISADNKSITYRLPNEDKKHFPKLFEELEKESHVQDIVVSVTTFEDVFLKIANMKSEVDEGNEHHDIQELSIVTAPEPKAMCGFTLNRAFILVRNRLNLLIVLFKQYLYYFLTSLFIVLLTVLLSTFSDSSQNQETELKLTLNDYAKSTVFYSGDSEVPEIRQVMAYLDQIIRKQNAYPVEVSSVSSALIKMGIDNIEHYKQHAVVAAEFNKTNDGLVANMMFSNLALHGAPIILNDVMSAIAKATINSNAEIITSNIPLKSATTDAIKREHSAIKVSLLWMILFPMGLLFLVGAFMVYPFKERITNLKHLLYMTGISPLCYWLQMFIFDYLLYIVCCFLLILLVVLNPVFRDINCIGTLFLISLYYGFMMIPVIYIFSYKNTIPSAFGLLTILSLFFGVVLTAVIVAFENSGDEKYEHIGAILNVVFHISPQYWLTKTIVGFSQKAVWIYNWDTMSPIKQATKCRSDQHPCCPINGELNVEECDAYKSYLNALGMKWYCSLGYAIIMGILFGAILLIFDSRSYMKVRNFLKGDGYSPARTPQPKDDTMNENENKFSVHHLGKTINRKEIVKELNFKVPDGTCFGLLGVNGAGKTTTFKMLTGDELPTKGTAQIRSDEHNTYDLTEQREGFLQKIGYCPQFDAINEMLTGRQLLTLFAELRGFEKQAIEHEVDKWIQKLGLQDYADICCGKYSGGNKRKLSLGISLIASPKVIMLDEPTTGVDPEARRKLWNVLLEIKNRKTNSIILTSHSMDECEYLCDNLAIMKKGEVILDGSITQLKLHNGKGLTVLIKIKTIVDDDGVDCVDGYTPLPSETEPLKNGSSNVDKVEAAFENTFKDLSPTRKDKHLSLLHYNFPDPKKLGCLYERMESFKTQNPYVEDYLINITTLEDVFISVATDNSETPEKSEAAEN